MQTLPEAVFEQLNSHDTAWLLLLYNYFIYYYYCVSCVCLRVCITCMWTSFLSWLSLPTLPLRQCPVSASSLAVGMLEITALLHSGLSQANLAHVSRCAYQALLPFCQLCLLPLSFAYNNEPVVFVRQGLTNQASLDWNSVFLPPLPK